MKDKGPKVEEKDPGSKLTYIVPDVAGSLAISFKNTESNLCRRRLQRVLGRAQRLPARFSI